MNSHNKNELNQLRRSCRHKAEIPIMIVSVILTAFIVYLLAYYGLIADESPDAVQAISDLLSCDLQTADDLLDIRVYIAVILLVLIPGKFLWALYRDSGNVKAWEVPVNDRQYGFIMEIWREYADKLGLQKAPSIYASNSTMLKLKNYSIKNIRILRISPNTLSNSLKGDDTNVRYIVAKEAAAMFLRYQNPLMPLLLTCTNWIPLLNLCFSRALCYSVDRVVRELLGEETATRGLLQSIVVPYLHNSIDYDAYVADINACSRPKDRFILFVENLLSDEPIPKFRVAAMTDPEKKSGRLL